VVFNWPNDIAEAPMGQQKMCLFPHYNSNPGGAFQLIFIMVIPVGPSIPDQGSTFVSINLAWIYNIIELSHALLGLHFKTALLSPQRDLTWKKSHINFSIL